MHRNENSRGIISYHKSNTNTHSHTFDDNLSGNMYGFCCARFYCFYCCCFVVANEYTRAIHIHWICQITTRSLSFNPKTVVNKSFIKLCKTLAVTLTHTNTRTHKLHQINHQHRLNAHIVIFLPAMTYTIGIETKFYTKFTSFFSL